MVHLLLTQDYLLDNHIKEDWEKREETDREGEREKTFEVKREKGLND